ncbi:MAG: serine hydrolase domain-containing protein [Gemmatimonadota bacterium]
MSIAGAFAGSAIVAGGGCRAESRDPADSAATAGPPELATVWEQPPGDPLEHELAGFAKILCSAVFVTGRTLADAAEQDGHFVTPVEARAQARDTIVDRARKTVSVITPSGVTRSAKFFGDQGCVTLPAGQDSVFFRPVAVRSALPDPATQPWPMGDVLPNDPLPPQVNADKLSAAIDSAFSPAEGLTAALVITWRGRLVGERYQEGFNHQTLLPSWSMGKSLTATLMGVLIRDGVHDLWQPAPVPEWQGESDPRREIRIADILRMSSGLRFPAPQDPDYDRSRGYPDHLYVYTGAINAHKWAATRPLQWPPNTVGRYRNSDPLVTNYLVRLAVEAKGEEYLSWPQRRLFDRLGIRGIRPEPDPWGGFLLQGYELARARDWARLGNLYLQMGNWNGEQILDSSFVDFVRTPAPAWSAPQYGGFFWLNRTNALPLPPDAYYMAGAGGQYGIIIPTHDLVVVRLGHYKGSASGSRALDRALTLLLEAVPKAREPWTPPTDAR